MDNEIAILSSHPPRIILASSSHILRSKSLVIHSGWWDAGDPMGGCCDVEGDTGLGA